MNKNNLKINLKDHSRFNRWVSNLDDKDKTLERVVRKRKWILIITGIFFLFVLSFFLFPATGIQSEKLDTPFAGIETTERKKSTQSAFELPVDSFENQLKIRINENIPEKE